LCHLRCNRYQLEPELQCSCLQPHVFHVVCKRLQLDGWISFAFCDHNIVRCCANAGYNPPFFIIARRWANPIACSRSR
jgi:hypothetical protein